MIANQLPNVSSLIVFFLQDVYSIRRLRRGGSRGRALIMINDTYTAPGFKSLTPGEDGM